MARLSDLYNKYSSPLILNLNIDSKLNPRIFAKIPLDSLIISMIKTPKIFQLVNNSLLIKNFLIFLYKFPTIFITSI